MTIARWNWGVPDWRDESAYPSPENCSSTQWKWEFLRRRPDYREDWLLHFNNNYRDLEKEFEAQKGPVPPGFLDFEGSCKHVPTNDVDRCRRKYDTSTLYDPSESTIFPGLFTPNSNFLLRYTTKEDFELYNREGLMPFVFDIHKPLKPQLRRAEVHLSRIQRELHGLRTRRKHVDKWPLYLRVIDARDAGETWHSISLALLSNEPDPTSHETDVEGYDRLVDRTGSVAAAKARQTWDQAREIMFNFPD